MSNGCIYMCMYVCCIVVMTVAEFETKFEAIERMSTSSGDLENLDANVSLVIYLNVCTVVCEIFIRKNFRCNKFSRLL